MNIHSIHFEEGIRPRLRSAAQATAAQSAAPQQKETFQPSATTDQTQADLAKLRQFAFSSPNSSSAG